MAVVTSRSLNRAERALAYAAVGLSTEVVFTAVRDLLGRATRTPRLEGHSYLWMGPVYGLCAVLYEPLHDRLRERPRRQRAVSYAGGILLVEYVSGRLIQRVAGVVPWDYTGRGRLVIRGATRLDYAPFWAMAGLLLEPVDDVLRGARVRRPR